MRLGVTNKIDLTSPYEKQEERTMLPDQVSWLFFKIKKQRPKEARKKKKMSYSKQTKPIMNTGCMSDVYDEVDIKSQG